MRTFILRHGEAQLFANRDADRMLTAIGRQQTIDILTASAAELRSVTRIVASPYVRAQQTAALAAELLALPVATSPLLVPEGELMAVAGLLESRAGETLLLVSHQPLVGNLVNWFCGLEPGRHRMGTSALACIDAEIVAGSCGELRWLRQPDTSPGY